MRRIVDPPPATRCKLCGGELRLKKVEAVVPVLGINAEILICVGCGREETIPLNHDLADLYKMRKLTDG
jgi:hypothetical protein